ncbi:predicted protein [Histoplasma capsulatum H143]|uniref:Uncharacterized protein n=1 Tax=Ajellomyces capsulatus (strain H143) TaxID=544712 RepID=C6H1Q1_AJECH|nr:predicted protein [Histoplasma capsulatum H143]
MNPGLRLANPHLEKRATQRQEPWGRVVWCGPREPETSRAGELESEPRQWAVDAGGPPVSSKKRPDRSVFYVFSSSSCSSCSPCSSILNKFSFLSPFVVRVVVLAQLVSTSLQPVSTTATAANPHLSPPNIHISGEHTLQSFFSPMLIRSSFISSFPLSGTERVVTALLLRV